MLQLQGMKQAIGLRQVDVFAGLNVMILLLELNRYAKSREDLKEQIVFYPCGEPDTEGFDRSRLFKVIGYSCCINSIASNANFRKFLKSANLVGANLAGADLVGANLSNANLVDATLVGTNLMFTNLAGADLSSANLTNAILFNALLYDADLSGANLACATFLEADLNDADLSGANLYHVFWDENTEWEDVRGVETARNVPEALKKQLELEGSEEIEESE
jgi:hypothetical protein